MSRPPPPASPLLNMKETEIMILPKTELPSTLMNI